MTPRRIFWIIFSCLTVLAIGGIGFLTFFEEVTVKNRTPPAAEARRNPYLALERFMQRMDRPLLRQNDARVLDALPAGGILILDDQRRVHMTPARVANLLTWVEKGGQLIVTPEPGVREDPLLKAFQVTRWQAPESKPANEDDDEAPAAAPATSPPANTGWCGPRPPPPPGKKVAPWPNHFTVQPPGSARPLSMEFSGIGLCAGARAPEWSAGVAGYGAQILNFRHGQGQVTFINNLRRWYNNWRIAEQDHAEVLWALIGQAPPTARVTLVTRLSVPTLREWLVENMSAALIALAALLLLWLWRVVPRFGPPRPEKSLERRQLREHLAALGRYVWRMGGREHWLRIARETFMQRLNLRHPSIAALPPGEQASALSRLTHRPATLIASALHAPANSPAAFTLALRTLKNLEQSL